MVLSYSFMYTCHKFHSFPSFFNQFEAMNIVLNHYIITMLINKSKRQTFKFAFSSIKENEIK